MCSRAHSVSEKQEVSPNLLHVGKIVLPIFLLAQGFFIQDLNMVVVATANVPGVFDPDAWPDTKAVMELVGEFISNV